MVPHGGVARRAPADRAHTAPASASQTTVQPDRRVVLTNADIDHVADLLTLREGHPLSVYAIARVHQVLSANSIFNVLDAPCPAPLVPGKVALWLEDRCSRHSPIMTLGECAPAGAGSTSWYAGRLLMHDDYCRRGAAGAWGHQDCFITNH